MNAERRKRIAKLVEGLESIQQEIEYIRDEEQEYMENIPENLQGSERYETAEEAVGLLDDVINNVADAVSTLSDIS